MILVSTETDFIDNFIIIYLIEIFTHYINKDYQKKYVITDLLIAIINGFIGLYIENLNLVIWFLTTLIYQKCSKKKLNYQYLNARLFAIINILIIALLSSCIESIMIKNTFQNIFGNNYSNNLIAYIRIVLYVILLIFLFIIIEKQKNKINYIIQKIHHLNLNKNIFKLLLFLVISFVGILTISEVTKITNIIILPIFIIFIIFVILTFIQVFSFIQAYSYRQETEAKIVQNQQLQEYLQNTEQQYQELRHFKHDYQNMLLALEGFAKKGNQQQFKDYYHQLVQQRPQTENLEELTISHIDYLKNEPLRGLIIQKFFAAKQDNIQLQLEIDQNIEIHNPDILSIVRILGILLDNALEQTAQENEKVVTCAFNQTADQIIEITIANPATNLTNIDQLFANGYTTKQDHHGFGLNNVQKMVKQNKNLFLETELLKQHLNITLMITGEE